MSGGNTQLRDLRIARGFTRADLAAISGISRKSIWALETGHATNPRAQTVYALAKALGCKISDIDPFAVGVD